MLQVRYLCFCMEVSDRVEVVRWLSLKCIFPQQSSTCSVFFFSKPKFFGYETLCLNATDAVPRFSCVGPSELMSLMGLKLSLSMVILSPSWLRFPWAAAAAEGLGRVRVQPVGKGLQRQPGFFRYPQGKILAAILMPHLLPSSLLSAN